RAVERLDPADPTEEVAGRAGAEAVLAERLAPLVEVEARARDHQVEEAGHPADRAVAGERLDLGRRLDLEADRAAVAGAGVSSQLSHGRRSSAPRGTT